MNRSSTARIAPLIASAIITLPVLSCFSERSSIVDPGGDGCEVPGSAIGAGQAVVFIRDFAFHPDTIRIAPGTRVTWVNCEEATVESHTSTAVGGLWDTGLIDPGGSESHMFTGEGSHGYFCQPHPSMVGAVIVE